MFLQHGDQTQSRSLTDPWELDGTLLFEPDVLLNTIFMKGGCFAPLYQNVATFYKMNKFWWDRHKPTFQKWWEVIDDEYTPLWDRDGFEETTDKTVDDGVSTGTKSSTEVMDDDTTEHITNQTVEDNDTTGSLTSREVTDTDTTNGGTTTEVVDDDGTSTSNGTKGVTGNSTTSTTHDVSAYDSEWVTDPVTGQRVPQYQPEWRENESKNYTENTTTSDTTRTTDDKTTTTTKSETGTVDTEVGKTESTTGTSDTTTDFAQDKTGTDDRTTTFNENSRGTDQNTRDYTHEHHSWGNWGITTTAQKLLEQELRIRAFDIYEHMADMFLDELTIRVYV